MIRAFGVSCAWLAAGLLATACGGSMPEQTAMPSTDPAPVNAISDRYVAAFNAGDAQGLARLYAEDATYMPDHHAAVEGRAAIEQYLQDLFAQNTGELTVTPADTEVTGDLAHVHGSFMTKVTPKAGGEPMMEDGKYLVILKRQADGVWLIHHLIGNSNVPPPAMVENDNS